MARFKLCGIAVMALALVACGGGDESADPDEAPAPSESPEPDAPDTITVTSADGDLVLEVPADEPRAAEVAVAVLDPADYPPELAGAEQTPGTVIYRLTPDGATFTEPVRVTRRLDASNFDLSEGQVALVMPVTRSSDGTFEVLEEVSLRRDGDDLFVSASASHFSDAFFVRGDLVVEPLILDIPTELVDQLDTSFDYGLGPEATVTDVSGLECSSPDGRLIVVRQLTDEDIADLQAIVEAFTPPQVEFEIPVDLACSDGTPTEPDRVDVTVFVAVAHGSSDSDLLFEFDVDPFGPAGGVASLGLVDDPGCDGPDPTDRLLNPPFPLEPSPRGFSSTQKIFQFGCYTPALTSEPIDDPAIVSFEDLQGQFPDGGLLVPAEGAPIRSMQVTEIQEVFADGFESGDTTPWGPP